jgi:tripartite-type tricarboxylate transporter receptor subunit TctC
MTRKTFLALGAAALGSSLAKPAYAQGWPRRPITIVVPFDVGGGLDRLARGFARYMPKFLGQPITVVNRPGVAGMIGTNWLLQQPADGYTVMLTSPSPSIPMNILVINAHYTLEDFTFVNAQWTDFTALFVPNNRPWRTVAELIEAIRTKPGKISTAVDFGSVGHITLLSLLSALGIKANAVRLVTFEGSGSMRTALAGGQVDFNIGQADGAEVIRSFVRPLAVFLDHRAPEWDAPPINEALKTYGVSVPLLTGSVRSFVFPAAFKAKHPADYSKFVSAYRSTLDMPAFKTFLKNNFMGGNWVGEERTTQIVRKNFEILKKYKGLLNR